LQFSDTAPAGGDGFVGLQALTCLSPLGCRPISGQEFGVLCSRIKYLPKRPQRILEEKENQERMKMFHARDTISGAKLVQKWQIDILYLSYLIMKHDLAILDPDPAENSLLAKTDTQKVVEIIKNEPRSLYQKLFLVSEVERIEKKLSFPPAPNPHPTQILKSLPDEGSNEINEHVIESVTWTDPLQLVIEAHESDIKKSSNVFSLIGKVWFVKFSHEEWGLYPDQEKYRFIAQLLSLSNSSKSHESEYSIYNADLYEKVSGKAIAKDFKPDDEVIQELNESDLSDKLSADELIRFRIIGHHLLEKLKEAREAGDQDHVKEAQRNIDTYRLHIFNEYGIKTVVSKDEKRITLHESYRASNEIKKLRQVVKNQIRNAIKDFDRMRNFKFHLQHSLKVKSDKTFYSPEHPTAWYVSM
jgi:hypothetical protein